MKMNLEYGFNNESMPKFEEYEITVINNIKYVVPKILEIHRTNYSLIDFDDYKENDKPLIDFINLGKLSIEQKENTDKLLLEYVNQYGLLGLIHDFPVNRYYTLDKEILLKEFNYINNSDCFSIMKIVDYFKIFFPIATDEEIKKLLEKVNKNIYEHSMEKFISPEINNLLFENEKYYEQVDMIIKYAQFMYNILKELKKEWINFHSFYIL